MGEVTPSVREIFANTRDQNVELKGSEGLPIVRRKNGMDREAGIKLSGFDFDFLNSEGDKGAATMEKVEERVAKCAETQVKLTTTGAAFADKDISVKSKLDPEARKTIYRTRNIEGKSKNSAEGKSQSQSTGISAEQTVNSHGNKPVKMKRISIPTGLEPKTKTVREIIKPGEKMTPQHRGKIVGEESRKMSSERKRIKVTENSNQNGNWNKTLLVDGKQGKNCPRRIIDAPELRRKLSRQNYHVRGQISNDLVKEFNRDACKRWRNTCERQKISRRKKPFDREQQKRLTSENSQKSKYRHKLIRDRVSYC